MVRKKVVGVLVFSIMILLLVNFVAASADVAYILNNDRVVKSEILDVFDDLGLSVDIIEDNDILKYNLNNYRLIFIDDARLRKTENLPIYNYPSVIMNKYYGEEWGLTDYDGVSQLASTAPLSVKIGSSILQVYTQAKYNGGVSIPYYFLDDHNKAPGMITIARTYTGDGKGYDFGDVIAVAPAGTRLTNGKTTGGKICFYGIAKTPYWTPNARNLFIDCVESVLVKCESDSICGTDGAVGGFYCGGVSGSNVYRNYRDYTCNNPGTVNSYCSDATTPQLIKQCSAGCENGECIVVQMHDVALDQSLSNSVGGIRLEYTNGTDILGNAVLNCNKEYKIVVNVLNLGTFYENITFNGNIDGLVFNHNPKNNLAPSDNSLKTKTLNFTLAQGFYNITVRAVIAVDNNLLNNIAKRQIQIICPECVVNSECGTPSSELICIGKNVMNRTTTPTCVSGQCENITSNGFIEACVYNCVNGACITPIMNCSTNADCDDLNTRTFDQCVNPGTTESYCVNTEMNCLNNLDCGITGFIGQGYCWMNAVYKNYQTSICNNPATLNSNCNINISPMLIQNCNDGNPHTYDYCVENGGARCEHGLIRCYEDSDCGAGYFLEDPFCQDGNIFQEYMGFICNNPGLPSSYCSNRTTLGLRNDCGIDGFEAPYCMSSNLYHDFVDYSCENYENLVDNGGFELGLDGWRAGGWWSLNRTADIDSVIFNEGSSSIRLGVAGVTPSVLNYCDGGTYQPTRGISSVDTRDVILLEPNTEYEMRSWVRLDKDASINTYAATMLVVLYKTNPEWDVNVGSCNKTVAPGIRISYPIYAIDLNANEWTEISRTFETNDENLYARLWLIVGIQKGLNETATAWFDGVELKETGWGCLEDRSTSLIQECTYGCINGECVVPIPNGGGNGGGGNNISVYNRTRGGRGLF